ncbi:MAG TPA: transketolase [Acidimicrobiales bacterium]
MKQSQDHAATERLAIDVLRGLAMDAPEQAKSGHQGTAMALAPLAHVLFTRILRHDPTAPTWPDRDRFVLSAGHASILLYGVLHIGGYEVSRDDLVAFRQWGSSTPGHPEVGHTPGVEVTTGPLGQGVGNSVGMAIAERQLRRRYGSSVFDHRVYAVCGDGDLMEGVSHEAASLAGHLGLGRLIWVFDDNGITIDGRTDLSCSDDAAQRFGAYGWSVIRLDDAEDLGAIEAGLRQAAAEEERPTLIVLRTQVAFPSPKWTGSHKAHGNPFDAEEIAVTKELMGLPRDHTFWVPTEVRDFYRKTCESGQRQRREWMARLDKWDGDRGELDAALAGRGIQGWATKLPSWSPGEKVATRVASNACMDAVADVVPGLVSGAADLTGNTGTAMAGADAQTAATPAGRQVYFGIREHGMAAAMVGMALHGGALPVGGTFLVFSDYMRPAIRLAALSGAHVIYSFSHDSVGVGEDGPTHQPVEHVQSLRAIPGLRVIRPADANEVAQAWQVAVDADGPTALILTRQAVPVLEGTVTGAVDKGAYVLHEPDGPPQIVLIGTGSEVAVCVAAADDLAASGLAARVVSMPSWELFVEQSAGYQESVLGDGLPRLAVEAGATHGWERWADATVGIDRFGASAPGGVVLDKLGINPDNVAQQARALLGSES